jgi:hypothetical protein
MSTFVSLQELANLSNGTTISVCETLAGLNLFANGRPTLLALVRGIAKKYPYAHREGSPRHDYRWSTAKTLSYLMPAGPTTATHGALGVDGKRHLGSCLQQTNPACLGRDKLNGNQ